jgi:hypothetical protein
VDTDDIDGFAVEDAVREVLDTVYLLRSRDAAADDGDISIVETNGEFEMACYVTEPGFAGGDGPDAAKRLVLEVDALLKSITVRDRISFGGNEQV